MIRALFNEGSKGGGERCDPVSRTHLNQIHVSRINEAAEFTNHVSFLAIFTLHCQFFANEITTVTKHCGITVVLVRNLRKKCLNDWAGFKRAVIYLRFSAELP